MIKLIQGFMVITLIIMGWVWFVIAVIHWNDSNLIRLNYLTLAMLSSSISFLLGDFFKRERKTS